MSLGTWIWLTAGIALMLLELALPGFVVIFLGLGAIGGAGLKGLGLLETTSAAFMTWVISSLFLLLALRRFGTRLFPGDVSKDDYDEDEEAFGAVVKEIDMASRRALVAKSQGEKQSRINRSEGLKTELINRSEGEMQRRINEAEGMAQEIDAIAAATADSIRKLAAAISVAGGKEALRLQMGEKLIHQLKSLVSDNTQIILPANLLSVDELLSQAGLGTRNKSC